MSFWKNRLDQNTNEKFDRFCPASILSCPADDFKHAVYLWNDYTQSLPIECVGPIGSNKNVNIYTPGAQWTQLVILIFNNHLCLNFGIWTINLPKYRLRKSLNISGNSLRHNEVQNTTLMRCRNERTRLSFSLNSPLCKLYMLKHGDEKG